MTLSRDDALRRVRAVLRAVAVEVCLRTARLDSTCRRLGVRLVLDGPVAPFRSTPLPAWTQREMHAVEWVLRRSPFPDTCLRRSLLTAMGLRSLAPELRIGWMSSPPPGNAHAWLQLDGESLEDGLSSVVPLRYLA